MEERDILNEREMDDLTPSAEWLPAIVSIDIQTFGQPYEPETGFRKGTVFPALYKPFCGGGASNGK